MTRLISTAGEKFGKLKKNRYTIGEHTCRSIHSSFALSTLLSRTDQFPLPDEILFLTATSIDESVKEQLRDGAEQAGVDQITFSSTNGLDFNFSSRVRQVIEWVNQTDCIVDLTEMPPELVAMFSFYVSALQFSSTSDESSALFVGKRSNDREEIRFNHLEGLVKLPDWGNASDVLSEHLEGEPLANQLEELHDTSYKCTDRPKSRRLQQLGKMISGSTRNLTAALPLEAGMSGSRKPDSFWQEVIDDANGLNPYIQQLLPEIRDHFRQTGVDSTHTEKTNIRLTEDELKRQYRCAQRLVNSRKLLPAYLLARELLVNGALLGTSSSVPSRFWLDGDTRAQAAAPFYLLNHWNQYDELRELPYEHQQRISRLWGAIKTRRNKLAHAGFSNEPIHFDRFHLSIKSKLESIRSLILEKRHRLEEILQFPFTDHLFVFAPGRRSPEECHEFRMLRDELDHVSSLIVLVLEEGNREAFQRRCNQQIGESVSVDFWSVPDQKGRFEYGQALWTSNRRDLLQNESVTLSIEEGPASTQHAIRQLYDHVSRFGIGTQLVGYERAGSEGNISGLITIDSNWMS